MIKTFSTTYAKISRLHFYFEINTWECQRQIIFYQRKRRGRDYIKTSETNIPTKYEEERWKLN
jgi:hypothetical protein